MQRNTTTTTHVYMCVSNVYEDMSCKLNRINDSIELASNSFVETKWIWCYVNKTEANLASTKVLAARCVRVIHAQCVLQFALLSRTLLRSSSNNEPSDPPYRMIFFSVYVCLDSIHIQWQTTMICWIWKSCNDKSYMRLVIYIMVRHNHIRTHMCTWWWLREVEGLLLMII